MSASYEDVAAAIVTAIATNHGTGMDLSSPGAVLRGRYPVPPGRVPFAALSGPELSGRRGVSLSGWVHQVGLVVEAWARCAEATTDSRTTTGETLLHLLCVAIETAAKTPGNALYSIPDLGYEGVEVSDLDRADGTVRVGIGITFTLDRLVVGLSS